MEEPLSCLFQEANPARLHESLNLKVISSSSKSELTLAVCCIRKYSRFSFVQEGEKLIQNHRENQPFEFHYEFSITLIHGRPSWLEELVNWIPLGKEGRKRGSWFNENTGEYSMAESPFKHSEVHSEVHSARQTHRPLVQFTAFNNSFLESQSYVAFILSYH